MAHAVQNGLIVSWRCYEHGSVRRKRNIPFVFSFFLFSKVNFGDMIRVGTYPLKSIRVTIFEVLRASQISNSLALCIIVSPVCKVSIKRRIS